MRGISSRVICKLKMRAVARAMSRLQDHCDLRKRARWLVGKVIGRSKLMSQSKGMNTWVSAVRAQRERDRQDAFLYSFVCRMMSRCERKEILWSINTWKAFVTQMKRADQIAKRKAAERRRLEQAVQMEVFPLTHATRNHDVLDARQCLADQMTVILPC